MARIQTQKYYIDYKIEDGIVILDMLQVKNEHRNKGIAIKAMQSFINKFKGRTIELHAYPQDNTTTLDKLVNFYEKFGFDVVCGSELSGYEMKIN